MSLFYVLDKDHHVIEEPDVLVWAKFFEHIENRLVARTVVGSALISTVFLGLDHSFSGLKPLVFETMIFDCPKFADYQERYGTWDEAMEGHEKALKLVKAFK